MCYSRRMVLHSKANTEILSSQIPHKFKDTRIYYADRKERSSQVPHQESKIVFPVHPARVWEVQILPKANRYWLPDDNLPHPQLILQFKIVVTLFQSWAHCQPDKVIPYKD